MFYEIKDELGVSCLLSLSSYSIGTVFYIAGGVQPVFIRVLFWSPASAFGGPVLVEAETESAFPFVVVRDIVGNL